jgi:hypothetical protein
LLDGKEGVSGSSPEEGLNTCKTALLITAESLPIKESLAGRLEEWPRNSLQIVLLSDGAEHLPVKEGVEGGAAQREKSKRLTNTALPERQLLSGRSGDRFWGQIYLGASR